MSRQFQPVLALIAVLLIALAACSRRDEAINVGDDDPEMAAAITKARATLPQFWQAFEKREQGESDFALKVKIADAHGVEHFWATHIERRDGQTTGQIDNDPTHVKSVKIGERIPIPETNISDWLYMRGGKMVGNVTIRPLFRKMPAADVEKLKAMMADP